MWEVNPPVSLHEIETNWDLLADCPIHQNWFFPLIQAAEWRNVNGRLHFLALASQCQPGKPSWVNGQMMFVGGLMDRWWEWWAPAAIWSVRAGQLAEACWWSRINKQPRQNQTGWLVSHALSDHSLSLTCWLNEMLDDGKSLLSLWLTSHSNYEIRSYFEKCSLFKGANHKSAHTFSSGDTPYTSHSLA